MSTIDVAVYKAGASLPDLRPMDNDLGAMQNLVGGYIEKLGLPDGLVLVCNEDGISRRLPVGFVAVAKWGAGQPIHGDFFVCRTQGAEFSSLKGDDFLRLVEYVRAV